MKKGISVWCLPAIFTLEQCFSEAKNRGFEGVEIALGNNGITEDITDAEVENIKLLASKYGIEIFSVACGLYFDISLTSNDENQRAHAERLVKKQLDIASILGCDTILIVPGAVSCPWNPAFEKVSYDVVYERSLEALKRLAPYAEEKGVCIGIENVWNKFLISPVETRDFIDKIGSEWVKVYFDVGNVLPFGYPEQWIEILGKRIKKVHIKDFKTNIGNLDGFVDLLTGDVNFPAVMESLKKIGYDSWITAEIGPHNHYPLTSVDSISSAMDGILSAYK